MKKSVMPYAAKALSSDTLLNMKRRLFEWKRTMTGQSRRLTVYIAVDDPYSFLLLQVLPEFVQRFDLNIDLVSIEAYQHAMFPELAKWRKNALVDAQRLANLYELQQPKDLGQLNPRQISQMTSRLLAMESDSDALHQALSLFSTFWSGRKEDTGKLSEKNVEQLNRNQSRLEKAGHYLPAVVHYAGEWYWGLDRLGHLEQRLLESDVGIGDERQFIRQQLQFLNQTTKAPSDKPITIFYSARSPYSYLGLEQAKALCEHYQIPLMIKPVLPMMMRGLHVPDAKKMAIFHDTKREAKVKGIPYGFVADPLGEAVEKGYAVYQYACLQNKGLEFLIEFGRAVNSQGIRADQERGLKLISERAGLDWSQAKPYLAKEEWRHMVADNMRELSQLGLWGVPCFHYIDTVVWGQDRLWVIEQMILDKDREAR